MPPTVYTQPCTYTPQTPHTHTHARIHTHAHTGTLGLCSEAKGLLRLAHSKKAEIRPFPPGHIHTYELDSQGSASLVSETRFLPIGGSDPSLGVILSSCRYTNVRNLLKEAVRKRLMADRRIGCLLSGGLDSSLVCALVAECIRENGTSYTRSGDP